MTLRYRDHIVWNFSKIISPLVSLGCSLFADPNTIRYDTIEEFNVDSKADYSALSSTRSQKKKLKQTAPVAL